MEATAQHSMLRELDHRSVHGIDVSLLWNPVDDQTFVFVDDSSSGESLRIAVAGANALDAFHHPYAYAPTYGDWSFIASRVRD